MIQVLRAEPDHDTVRALGHLAEVEVFADSPDADQLTSEALTLSQALGASASVLCDLLTIRGIFLIFASRLSEAAA